MPVPIQRTGRDNNALIKAGAVPIVWGQDTKLIASHACTSVHDSQVLEAVLRGEAVGGKEVWADSAYHCMLLGIAGCCRRHRVEHGLLVEFQQVRRYTL